VFAIRRHDNGPVRRTLRAAALALLVGCAATLAGCSPPSRVNSAVYLRDGTPTVVVHLCSDEDRLTALRLQESRPEPSASAPTESAAPQPLRAWHIGNSAGTGYDEIRLLDTPPGWTVYTNAENLLSELRDDQSYQVEVVYKGPSGGRDRGTEFTLGDLRSLATGQVWSRPKPYDREVPMTLDAFRRAANRSC
jgi:hypothetical protein